MLCDLVERFRNGLDCKYSNIGQAIYYQPITCYKDFTILLGYILS